MTTIAWDGKTLAADSLQSGSYVTKNTQKIFDVDGVWVTGAGRYQDLLALVRWVKEGSKRGEEPTLEDDFCGMIVRNGVAYQIECKCIEWEAEIPYALGSGCDMAMGAMLAGVNAYKAVEIASRLDSGTGGLIQIFQVDAAE